MALWGNNDNVTTASAGIVTASGFNGEVLGTGTTFTNYAVGQVLTVGKGSGANTGSGGTSGFAVIASIGSTEEMQLVSNDHGAMDEIVGTFNGSADAFIVGERPKFLTDDPAFAPTSANNQRSFTAKVYGVDETMQAARNTTSSQFKPPHAGWVGVTTYMDTHGNLRVKTETFVAMSGISTQTQAVAQVMPA